MNRVQKDLLTRFREAVNRLDAINDGDAVLCALSGGPDSMALFDLLERLSRDAGFLLVAAHLNHRLRGEEADRDEEFVQQFCTKRGIELHVGHVDTPELAREQNISIEMAARDARFKFLLSAAGRTGCKSVALGHTADDRVENLLMRLFRGAGGRGLGSLQPVRERDGLLLIRPLLDFFRMEIIDYLDFRGLSYRVDSTNLDKTTDRGRIRNVLLPALEKMAEDAGLGSVRESLARSAELITEDETYLQGVAGHFIDRPAIDDAGQLRIPKEEIASLPSPVLGRLLLDAISQIDPDLRPEREHITAIEDMLKGSRKGSCDLPGGLRAENTDDFVLVHRPLQSEEPAPSQLQIPLEQLPCSCEFGRYKLNLSLLIPSDKRTQTLVEPSYEGVRFSLPETCNTLVIRIPQPGDRMAPLGMKGHTKKLSDIFIDKKVRRELRRTEPVIVDSSNASILALPGLGLIAENAKVTESCSRVVSISLEQHLSRSMGGDVIN